MIDVSYEKWIGLTGREEMTNCVFILGSGHVTNFLRRSVIYTATVTNL